MVEISVEYFKYQVNLNFFLTSKEHFGQNLEDILRKFSIINR